MNTGEQVEIAIITEPLGATGKAPVWAMDRNRILPSGERTLAAAVDAENLYSFLLSDGN